MSGAPSLVGSRPIQGATGMTSGPGYSRVLRTAVILPPSHGDLLTSLIQRSSEHQMELANTIIMSSTLLPNHRVEIKKALGKRDPA
jgi:hypothetical protein